MYVDPTAKSLNEIRHSHGIDAALDAYTAEVGQSHIMAFHLDSDAAVAREDYAAIEQATGWMIRSPPPVDMLREIPAVSWPPTRGFSNAKGPAFRSLLEYVLAYTTAAKVGSMRRRSRYPQAMMSFGTDLAVVSRVMQQIPYTADAGDAGLQRYLLSIQLELASIINPSSNTVPRICCFFGGIDDVQRVVNAAVRDWWNGLQVLNHAGSIDADSWKLNEIVSWIEDPAGKSPNAMCVFVSPVLPLGFWPIASPESADAYIQSMPGEMMLRMITTKNILGAALQYLSRASWSSAGESMQVTTEVPVRYDMYLVDDVLGITDKSAYKSQAIGDGCKAMHSVRANAMLNAMTPCYVQGEVYHDANESLSEIDEMARRVV